MVSSAHEKVVWEADLPRQKSDNDLDGEGASIDEISVEQVWVLLRGGPVDLENVEQVVVLAVDIAADGDLFLIFPVNAHQRLVLFEYLLCFHNYHASILFVKHFSIFLPLH